MYKLPIGAACGIPGPPQQVIQNSVNLSEHGCPLYQRPAKDLSGPYANGFVCDFCRQGTTSHRWHCSVHSYDVCTNCLSQKLGLSSGGYGNPNPSQQCSICYSQSGNARMLCNSCAPAQHQFIVQPTICGTPSLPGEFCCHDVIEGLLNDLSSQHNICITGTGRSELIEKLSVKCGAQAMSVDELQQEIALAIFSQTK